jgi:hypothetical protein
MPKHIGCEETDVEFLDYMLQYEALSAAHIEAVHGIALIRAAGNFNLQYVIGAPAPEAGVTHATPWTCVGRATRSTA